MSPGNLASNPRLLKEADALHSAGYDVTTVLSDFSESVRAFDDELVASAPWRVIRIARRRALNLRSAASALVARTMGERVPLSLACRAAGGAPVGAMIRAVRAIEADLYIAHYVAALPAAAKAARRHGALLGFDAEDFHSGEGTGRAGDDFRMRMVAAVERSTLPGCDYSTAASPSIGRAYAERYGITPTTILNVFPLAMAPQQPRPRERSPVRIKAYWFSQTIGLDRGLQAFVRAMALARCHVTLDLRGSNRWGHGDTLMRLAGDLGIADRVRLLPLASPGEMVRLAADYDLGLSLETDVSESRRLCLTNKIFIYLLAGIPMMLSDTPAQRALAVDLGRAAAVVPLAEPAAMASALDQLCGTEGALEEAMATAWRLGRERYNWEVEQRLLLAAVANAFEGASAGPAWRH
ncbi:MAG: hypothetical protein AB7F22_07375 [Reyranella sp.]|uniref:hypothetical protein n=1 Tax=Reyranella sp. TaxID=1929291 RepID=UPI003D0999EE